MKVFIAKIDYFDPADASRTGSRYRRVPEIFDLVAVAVEDHRRHAFVTAEKAFGLLRPARMRDARIHVRPEAVFIARQLFPEADRPLVGEGDPADALDVRSSAASADAECRDSHSPRSHIHCPPAPARS